MNPSLTKVILTRDVLHACLSHALSTEHQEIMGLLIGQIIDSEAHIHRSLVLSRRDKQKDRVEVGFEHLAAASTIAERLTDAESCQQNVLGWYHSHPHITVMPSHVDVKTQGCMQMLDSNFVGLIFSVFDKSGDMNVCAFQSLGVGVNVEECSWSRVEIPIVVTHLHQPLPSVRSLLARFPDEMCSEKRHLEELDLEFLSPCVESDNLKKREEEFMSVHKKESLVSLQQTLLSEAHMKKLWRGQILSLIPFLFLVVKGVSKRVRSWNYVAWHRSITLTYCESWMYSCCPLCMACRVTARRWRGRRKCCCVRWVRVRAMVRARHLSSPQRKRLLPLTAEHRTKQRETGRKRRGVSVKRC